MPSTLSTHERTGGDLWLGEVVATFGLLMVILGVVRSGRGSTAPFAVAGYIAAAYWFTSSTSFANPAVTIGRTLSNTFAGIDPASVPGVHRRRGPRRHRRDRPRLVPLPRAPRPSTSSCPTSNPTLPDGGPPCPASTTSPSNSSTPCASLPPPCTESSTARSAPRPSSSSSPPATTSSPPTPASSPTYRSWPSGSPASASRPSPRSRARPTTAFPPCSSCASTTPAAPRWRSAGSTTSPATGPSPGPAAPSPARRSTRPPCWRWPRSASTSPRSSPSPGPTRSCKPPTSSSRWAAATPAPCSPASATRTGSSTDPAGRDVDAVRPIRDEIEQRVRRLLENLGISPG